MLTIIIYKLLKVSLLLMWSAELEGDWGGGLYETSGGAIIFKRLFVYTEAEGETGCLDAGFTSSENIRGVEEK